MPFTSCSQNAIGTPFLRTKIATPASPEDSGRSLSGRVTSISKSGYRTADPSISAHDQWTMLELVEPVKPGTGLCVGDIFPRGCVEKVNVLAYEGNLAAAKVDTEIRQRMPVDDDPPIRWVVKTKEQFHDR